MQTKLPEINSNDIQAVRDFLIGVTDDVRITPSPTRPARPAHNARPAVPVSHGISRARIRSAKANA